MHEVERLVISKAGSPDGGEDAIVVTDDFACVVDGATSQTDRSWEGISGGRLAAETICAAVRRLAPESSAAEAVEQFTLALEQIYREHELYEYLRNEPLERATASVVLYSCRRNEVWFVGDCQSLMISDRGAAKVTTNTKLVDEVNAAARALFLHAELVAGRTMAQLRKNDFGREFIKPLLERQRCFQNSQPESPYSYWTIDGFAVEPACVKVQGVPSHTSEIVLASDGYPMLFPTLAATEQYLRDVIVSDPLLIKQPHQSTKGVAEGNDSYDDRAYLRLALA